jgi:hypothetical protein
MLFYIITLGILNCIGGRGKDAGMDHLSKVAFRFLLPVAATMVYCHYIGLDPYRVVIATLGTAFAYGLWFPWGWSFDEITGGYDAKKYPAIVQNIGLHLYPLDHLQSTNRKRGIIMKGLRGLYGYPGFILLAVYLNPLSLLYGLIWGLQGVVYWLYRDLDGKAVLMAEIADGMVKATAIGMIL